MRFHPFHALRWTDISCSRSEPAVCMALQLARMAGCSILVVTMWAPGRYRLRKTPNSVELSDSVPPDVKTTSRIGGLSCLFASQVSDPAADAPPCVPSVRC
jgi:hypothetical protein